MQVGKKTRTLLLAQLPPPIHGVTMITKNVHALLSDMEDLDLDHAWSGGARHIDDVGKKDLRKLTGFSRLLLQLLLKRLTQARYHLAYVTLAPHGDALARDALLIMAAKMLSTRVLVHLHTQGLGDILAGKTLYLRFVRRAIKNTELIAVASCVQKAALHSGHFAVVHLLPNFVDDPGPPAVRPGTIGGTIASTGGRLNCGYIGNLDKRKGALRFIDAIAALTAAGIMVDATIAGGPTRNLSLGDVQDYAVAKGVSDKVSVVGFIDGAAKSDLLTRLDVMIYLSEHDLAPLVLLEALAYGIAPIAFDTGGIRELLSPQFASHVLSRDRAGDRDPWLSANAHPAIDDVTALCKSYYNDRRLLQTDKIKARRRYEENYTAQLFRQRLAAIVAADNNGAAAAPETNLAGTHSEKARAKPKAVSVDRKAVA